MDTASTYRTVKMARTTYGSSGNDELDGGDDFYQDYLYGGSAAITSSLEYNWVILAAGMTTSTTIELDGSSM